MPVNLPKPPPQPPPGRFRSFMASTPPWFQWATLIAMFLTGAGIVILYLWAVKTPPDINPYEW